MVLYGPQELPSSLKTRKVVSYMTPVNQNVKSVPPAQASPNTSCVPPDTQENTPKPPNLIDPIIPLSDGEIIARAERDGTEYCFDALTNLVRTLNPDSMVSGMVPASEELLNSYEPPQEEDSPIVLMDGQEIKEYAKNTGQIALYDSVADRFRFADSSGKPQWIVSASSVGFLSSGSSESTQENVVEDVPTQNDELENINAAKIIEELNSLTETPPLQEHALTRSAPPMPITNSYGQNIPEYGGNGRQRITAAMLKNKVLNSCRLLVKDGVIFSFDGRSYQSLSEAKVRQLISTVCSRELEEYGRFEIVIGTLNFILSEPSIQLLESVENRKILTFQNGNLDVETGAFTGHDPSIFTTYALQCNYISHGAVCPVFDKFLYDITSGDLAITARIWEMLGYCLVPDIGAKVGFVLQGRKHSGKSLLCNFLESLFPGNVISALDAHDFSQKFALSELEGKALCVSADMPAEPLNKKVVSNIKKLSGNDLISAPKKYENNRQFRFGGKLILVSNHQVLPQADDDAFWDRLVAIPFPNTIPREQQDANLLHRLMPERDAIVRKAIEAYWGLRKRS